MVLAFLFCCPLVEFWEFNSILIFRFLFWIQPNCLDNYTTLSATFYGLILLCNKLWGYWIKAINMISFQTLLQGILTYLVWNFQNFFKIFIAFFLYVYENLRHFPMHIFWEKIAYFWEKIAYFWEKLHIFEKKLHTSGKKYLIERA